MRGITAFFALATVLVAVLMALFVEEAIRIGLLIGCLLAGLGFAGVLHFAFARISRWALGSFVVMCFGILTLIGLGEADARLAGNPARLRESEERVATQQAVIAEKEKEMQQRDEIIGQLVDTEGIVETAKQAVFWQGQYLGWLLGPFLLTAATRLAGKKTLATIVALGASLLAVYAAACGWYASSLAGSVTASISGLGPEAALLFTVQLAQIGDLGLKSTGVFACLIAAVGAVTDWIIARWGSGAQGMRR